MHENFRILTQIMDAKRSTVVNHFKSVVDNSELKAGTNNSKVWSIFQFLTRNDK